MIPVLVDGTRAAEARLAQLARRQDDQGQVEAEVAAILSAVRRDGDRALIRYALRFDRVRMRASDLVVDQAAIDRAERAVPAPVRQALELAHRRIARFHRAQTERGFELRESGLRLGMRVTPLARVGVYVPGGSAAYPSSVLMNVVPAKIAGVPDITVVTPAGEKGIRPEVLVAARLAGATRIVRVGGAQAVGALAYGTETVARVDKIVGPGNVYVATAKRLVFGQVDIDMIAGPSEVLIVADTSAAPEFIAADMLAQAEHDPRAAAVCLVDDEALGHAVAAELQLQLAELGRREIATRSLANYGLVLVTRSLDRAVEIANEIAPEHLELFVRRPRALLGRVRDAGAIFLGQHSTEALGDYLAGPNHVLPTGGTARFASPLGVYDFVKRTSIIEATRRGFERLAPAVERLAGTEGLDGHAAAVTRRRRRRGG
jgi:histidinol dehydrogenase